MDPAIFQHFQNHIQTTMAVGESCAQSLTDAADKLVETLLEGNTIYSCGQKQSAHLSKLLVSQLTLGHQIERPSFPAIDLESIRSGHNSDDAFARALDLHGHSNDALIVFSVGNNNPALKQTIATAVNKEMLVILISAVDDQLLTQELGDNDIEIATAEFGKSSTISAGFLVLQCLCTLIDNKIFGGE